MKNQLVTASVIFGIALFLSASVLAVGINVAIGDAATTLAESIERGGSNARSHLSASTPTYSRHNPFHFAGPIQVQVTSESDPLAVEVTR